MSAGAAPPGARPPGRLSAWYLGGSFALAFAIILGLFVYRMITHQGRRTATPAAAVPAPSASTTTAPGPAGR